MPRCPLSIVGRSSLTTALLITLAVPLSGQSGAQLTAGYGTVSAPRVVVAFASLFQEALSFGAFRTRSSRSTGARSLGLGLRRAGTVYELSGTVETITSDVLLDDGDAIRDGTQRITTRALLFGVTREYGGDESVRFFSGIALGPSFYTGRIAVGDTARSDSHKTTVAFQADLLGLSIGKRVSAWGVVGFGYRGTFRAGATYRF